MNKKSSKIKETKKAWKILFKHLKDYKPSIILLAVLGIISAGANGTVPYIVGSFLDALIDFSKILSIGSITITAWLGLLLLWVFVQLIANINDCVGNTSSDIFSFRLFYPTG